MRATTCREGCSGQQPNAMPQVPTCAARGSLPDGHLNDSQKRARSGVACPVIVSCRSPLDGRVGQLTGSLEPRAQTIIESPESRLSPVGFGPERAQGKPAMRPRYTHRRGSLDRPRGRPIDPPRHKEIRRHPVWQSIREARRLPRLGRPGRARPRLPTAYPQRARRAARHPYRRRGLPREIGLEQGHERDRSRIAVVLAASCSQTPRTRPELALPQSRQSTETLPPPQLEWQPGYQRAHSLSRKRTLTGSSPATCVTVHPRASSISSPSATRAPPPYPRCIDALTVGRSGSWPAGAV